MNTNDDYLSLNDFLSFVKKNIIFIIIVTSIFTYAGYYFNIFVDDEIEDRFFCAAKTKFKKVDVFSDSDRVFECVDLFDSAPSLYDEDIEAEEECNT